MHSGAKARSEPLDGYDKGRVPRSVREGHVMAVAERLFAERGYDGTSLEQVARRSGVTRQFLSKLFGDKEALYLACHRRARAQLNEMFAAVAATAAERPTAADSRQQLHGAVSVYFSFVRDHGAGWDVLFGSGAAVTGTVAHAVEEMRGETINLLASMLHHAAPEQGREFAQIAAHALSGSGNEVAKWWRGQNAVGSEELTERFVALFWNGLQGLVSG